MTKIRERIYGLSPDYNRMARMGWQAFKNNSDTVIADMTKAEAFRIVVLDVAQDYILRRLHEGQTPNPVVVHAILAQPALRSSWQDEWESIVGKDSADLVAELDTMGKQNTMSPLGQQAAHSMMAFARHMEATVPAHYERFCAASNAIFDMKPPRRVLN